jgi:DHA1 family bicyclomycin/chloramphenicol resistance-like MFS transporter
MTARASILPKTSRTFVALLVAMTALAPVSLQIFVPALPAIQSSFESSAGITQLVLSLSILANAFATLLYGPLSDRFGRRPVVMVGFVIFVIGSALSATAPTVGLLIIARIVQSAGAAAGMVLARAIIRDVYSREEAASVLAYLTMAMVVAPMLAPTLGALLIDNFDWRAIFVVMAFAGIVLSWQVWSHLEETHGGKAMTSLWTGLGRGGLLLLRRPSFLAYTLQSSFAISTFFAFIAGAPYFMIDGLGRSATEYGLLFMAISASFMAGNFTTARLSKRFGIDSLIRTGNIIALCGASLALGLMIAGYWSPFALFGPMMLVAFGNGLSIANSQAGAVSVQPDLAGTASGIAGFAQMFIAALVSQAVGMLQDGTPYPMVGFMAVCAALSLLSFSVGKSVVDTTH